MAKGIIQVTARVILHHMLQLSGYELQSVQSARSLSGGEEIIVFVVEVPELPGREDTALTLEPVYESKQDADGTTWYRLKEVRTI